MKKIFCVEDDADILELIEYTLNSMGFEVKGFEAAACFFAALKNNIPSLVLLDIMLPEEDGLSVLKKLRSNPKTKGIPVVMLTAKATEYDTVTGLDTGADDYITKPFGMMALLSRIKAVLRRYEKKEAKSSGGAGGNELSAGNVKMDMSLIHIRSCRRSALCKSRRPPEP